MEWLTSLLANAPPNAARVEALSAAGFLLVRRGEPQRARPLLEEAVSLARQLGERYLLVVSLHHLGEMRVQEGNTAAAKAALEESVAQNTGGEDWPVFWPPYVAFYNLGEVRRSRAIHWRQPPFIGEVLTWRPNTPTALGPVRCDCSDNGRRSAGLG